MKLTAKLPEDDDNGMGAVTRRMVDRPDSTVLVVAVMDTHKLTRDMDTNVIEPTVRIQKIEPLTTQLDIDTAQRLLDAAHQRRTGRNLLPLEGMADAVADAAFDGDGIDSVTISTGDGRTVTRTRGDDTDLLCRAAELVVTSDFGSVSMLQRKLGIDNAKAVQVIEALEHHGIVGEANGTLARDVLIPQTYVSVALTAIRNGEVINHNAESARHTA